MQSKQSKASQRGTLRTRGPSKRPQRRPRGPKRTNTIGASNGRAQPRSMPQAVSVGTIIPQSYFDRSQKAAQQNTEIGGMHDNVRISGCDLFAVPIKAGSSTTSAGFGGASTFWVGLSPNNLSPRLAQEEELWQYYAFRKVQVMSTPEVGTSVGVSAAVAVVQLIDVVSGNPTPTQQELLETTPSMKFPVYQTASIEYTHSGTKVWETSTEASPPTDNTVQAALGCVLSGTPVASTTYASLWIKYEIDFYKPSMVLGSPSRLREKADRLEDRLHEEKRCEIVCQRCNGRAPLRETRELKLLLPFPKGRMNSKEKFESKFHSSSEPESPLVVRPADFYDEKDAGTVSRQPVTVRRELTDEESSVRSSGRGRSLKG